MAKASGIVNIRGRDYETVASRVQRFRETHPDHTILTDIVFRDDDVVVMKASILDPQGRIIANGHAEEKRASSQINRTSALENAETSAIGRALAAFGIGGTEFASANEVQNAIRQQEEPEPESDDPRRAEIIAYLEAAVQRGGLDAMRAAWKEMDKGSRAMVNEAEIARITKLAPSEAAA